MDLCFSHDGLSYGNDKSIMGKLIRWWDFIVLIVLMERRRSAEAANVSSDDDDDADNLFSFVPLWSAWLSQGGLELETLPAPSFVSLFLFISLLLGCSFWRWVLGGWCFYLRTDVDNIIRILVWEVLWLWIGIVTGFSCESCELWFVL